MMIPKSLFDIFEDLWRKRIYIDTPYGIAFHIFIKTNNCSDETLDEIASLPYPQARAWIEARLDPKN